MLQFHTNRNHVLFVEEGRSVGVSLSQDIFYIAADLFRLADQNQNRYFFIVQNLSAINLAQRLFDPQMQALLP